MKKKNALVALGGGPSPVINASLLGVVSGCRAYPDRIGEIYGALHGIEGVLMENLMNLGRQDGEELEKLRDTPASGAIGTCRYKLQAEAAEDYNRIIDVLDAHGIAYFYYIGGNDSMDTAQKISDLARDRGVDLTVAGVPKTIDNDLGDEARTIIDHTPGFGSAARYWAMLMKDAEEENRGMCVSEPATVFQAMGRKAGFLTAASRLADPGREIPMQLYFEQSGQNMEQLYENVCRCLRERGRCIIVVDESFDVGEIGAERDGFGHIEYGASATCAAGKVASFLNQRGIPARGNVTWQVPGVLQRSTSMFRSSVDVEEAFAVGRHAVSLSVTVGTGYMATILRDENAATYRALYDKVPLHVVANSARVLPPEWIAADGIDVTDDFLAYARPLLGEGAREVPLREGFQDFARLDLRCLDRRCEQYRPMNFR
jgi:6-phosphofructokinase 1